ncbi:hypothetical protein [Halocatena pleomorpha]|uniref:Uncharacterized protein n=1 Tax=Halocatena pleomorpha TaxID=1785090 RepID=A0A3P3R5F6_9EURY|nr:hypothetical protein [Halocatena pleomorpha]RRJ28712.1 hypothetical protein EIK79_15015 [Halocatena pleomorpha]
MSLDVGEALIQSRDSWWLGKLGEPSGQATAGDDSRCQRTGLISPVGQGPITAIHPPSAEQR